MNEGNEMNEGNKMVIIGEVLICDICKNTYINDSNNDHLVCDGCIKEFFTETNEKETDK